MSYSMKIMPIYNRFQNITPIEQNIFDYNYKNYNKNQIQQNKSLIKNNSLSYMTFQENSFRPNQASINQISLTSPNITPINDNTQPIRIIKKSFKRQQLLPKGMQYSYYQTNINNNLENKLKYGSNKVSNLFNLYKINVLDDSKNDFNALENKPIEEIVSSINENIDSKKNSNIFLKFPLLSTEGEKIFSSNVDKNMDKFIHSNYFKYIENFPRTNEIVDINNNTDILLSKNSDLNSEIKKPLENKLFHSVNNFTKFYLNNNNYIEENNEINNEINNNIRIDINKKNKNVKYKENSNNFYFINNNANNKDYFNIYNGYDNKNNIANNYNINNNTMPIQFFKVNKIRKELEPESNFNLSEFIKLNLIGRGGEGVIYSVKWVKNNKKYALKKGIILTLESLKSKQDEIKMLKCFMQNSGNDGIIKIYGEKCILTNNGFYDFYEIMEFAEKDWEQEIINRGQYQLFYSENELLTIMGQIVKTFALLQKNHITHRDIKPQNIMLVKGRFKISDFGNSRLLKREGYCVQRIRGSEMFMSPVMFKGLHSNKVQVKHNTYKSDVFSLGMCFLLAASLSYNPLNVIRELYDMNAIYNVIYSHLGNRYSQNVLKILLSMLQVKEKIRPDFIELESLFPQLYIMK